MARSGGSAFQCRPADGSDRDIVAVVDVRRRDWHGAVDYRGGCNAGDPRLRAIADATDLRGADRVLSVGAGGHPVVGRILGRAALCGRPDREIAGAATAVLSL